MPTLEDIGLEPDPVIEAYKKDVDRTLLRENLKRTPEERLDRALDHMRFAESFRAIAAARNRPGRANAGSGV